MTALRWILWKDALTEARGWERLTTLAVFATVVLLTFHFSLPPESEARGASAPGFLWAAIVFAALLELRRSWDAERRDGTLDALRTAPIDPTTLLASKILSSFAVLAVLEAVLVPLTALFFSGRPSGVLPALGIALAGTVGLLAWGTLFAAMAGGTRSAEAVLAILLFPLVLPQTIACVRLLSHHLTGAPLDDPATAFLLLGAADLLAVGAAVLLFDYALDA